MKGKKPVLRVLAVLALFATALFTAGCGYTSPLTDHLVDFADTKDGSMSDLRSEWRRYVEIERQRLPQKKEVMCD